MADQFSQHPGALGIWHKVAEITPRPGQTSNLVSTTCKLKFPEKQTLDTVPDGDITCSRCS